MKETHGLLGRLAVHNKWLTRAQLSEAVAELGRFGNESKKMGEILVELGFLTSAQIDRLLVAQQAYLDKQAAKKKAAPLGQAEAGWTPGQDPFAAATQSQVPSAVPAPVEAASVGIELDWKPPAAVEQAATPLEQLTPPAAEPFTPPPEVTNIAPAPQRRAEKILPTSKLREAPLRSPHLDKILSDAARKGASDIHLHPGAPVSIRLHGVLVAAGETLTNAQSHALIDPALTESQAAHVEVEGQLDLAYPVEGIGRFRANIYEGHTGRNAVFRFIPSFVPSLQQLQLPSELSRFTTFHQGLVLVTGPAGCGKSTTMAALIDLINEEREDHILSVEDPVEYIHTSKNCLVNQREVHRHTTSFARALRAALREDPDVLVIGELRDLETISLAMTAAETGHLVLATLHTANSIRTINRLVGAFSPDEQVQIRTMLSESLRAVISQRLVRRADGKGRVPALEVLRVDRAVSNIIRENRTFQLRSTLQTGQSKGMMLLDAHLGQLVKSGIISREEALLHAEDPRLVGGA